MSYFCTREKVESRLNAQSADLLDVSRPGMDGFETCRQIKQMEKMKSIPVIFITARHEMESVTEGFKSGGTDYLTKPFIREEVIIRVKSHLENSRLHRLVEMRNRELERLNEDLKCRQKQLKTALANIKTLHGLIPICCYCKKIRNDKGYWEMVESYLKEHSEADFSHGICPDCYHVHYPEYEKAINESIKHSQ